MFLGRARVREFLLWHLDFFSRYRPLPDETWRAPEFAHPLLQTRMAPVQDGDPLDVLLARTDPAGREHVAGIAMGECDESAPPPPVAAAPAREDAAMATSNG